MLYIYNSKIKKKNRTLVDISVLQLDNPNFPDMIESCKQRFIFFSLCSLYPTYTMSLAYHWYSALFMINVQTIFSLWFLDFILYHMQSVVSHTYPLYPKYQINYITPTTFSQKETANLWKWLPRWCFPEVYNFKLFKSSDNSYLSYLFS